MHVPETITHPEKVMFPDDGITKGDLAAYYADVAPVMLPHLVGRPLTMERFHRGIGDKGFFQKNVNRGKGTPDWLETVAVPKKDGVVNYPVVRDARGLLWIANQNCITPHVWTSRVPELMHPDICVFDLDPLDDDADVLRGAALLLRDLLAELGCRSWVKTSGSKGFHIVMPLDGKTDWTVAARFAHAVGSEAVRRDPKHLTQEFYKADRAGRILVDTGRNEIGATYAATYAVRPRPTAPISAPCTWEELESGAVGPRTITLRSMSERLGRVGDLWADLYSHGRALPEPPSSA
jgi:bifunctional non-homologous end joining protein LigD